MKKLSAILILTGFILFSACKKDKDDSLPITVSNVNRVAVSGQWHETYYVHDGVNNGTSDPLYGYNFIFNSNGQLLITNITFNYPGSWSASEMNAQVKLSLDSPFPSAFTNLTKDWTVTGLSDTKIELEFVNSSSGTTDMLILEKNQ